MTASSARPAPAGICAGPGTRPGQAADYAPPRWRRLLPAWAGAGYLIAWAAGLAAWPSNLALNATNAQVAVSYRAHPAGAVTQYLLAEGVAGLLFGLVLAAALLCRRDRSLSRSWPAIAVAAAAVAISLTQTVIGMFLVAAATSRQDARAGGLSDLVNRLDGIKMLALAAVAAYLCARRTWNGRPPAWLRVIAALAAVTLAVSGVDYMLLSTSLAWTVYASGPLLLAWIAATGIWLTRSIPAGGAATTSGR